MLTALLLAALVAPPTPYDPAVSTDTASAFQDAAAHEMVNAARDRHQRERAGIERYEAVVRERISAGLRTPLRDRTLGISETAARVVWRSGVPVEVELLGSRNAAPAFTREVTPRGSWEVERDTVETAEGPVEVRVDSTWVVDGGEVQSLVFDPRAEDVFTSLFRVGGEERRLVHPLTEGSEAHYRFRSGATTTIRLPDGGEVVVRELHVIPRRDDPFLIRGSLWIDDLTQGVVRATFTTARPLDIQLDLRTDERSRTPRWLSPIEGEVRFVTMEFGLWERQWWMPRLVAIDVVGRAGVLAIPARFERQYLFETVEGAPPESAGSVAAELAEIVLEEERRGGLFGRCRGDDCPEIIVRAPRDPRELVESPELPPRVSASDPPLLDGTRLEAVFERLEATAEVPWRRPALALRTPRDDLGLVRYNRVEGLSLGLAAELYAGPLVVGSELRLGSGDLEPNAELWLRGTGRRAGLRAGAYRRLAEREPRDGGLGLGNSARAFLLGRDEGDYFRTLGGELLWTPPPADPQRFRIRAFAERQEPAELGRRLDVPSLLGREGDDRPNIEAVPATQFGIDVRRWRSWGGADPRLPRIRLEGAAELATGTFSYLRPELLGSVAVPLGGRWDAALAAGGGTSVGDLPPQREWAVGGVRSVRGFRTGEQRGDAHLRGRLEVGRGVPAARLIAFTDTGWAGPRDDLLAGGAAWSAGVGAGLLDGLVRVDLARGIRPDAGWRLHLSLDGMM